MPTRCLRLAVLAVLVAVAAAVSAQSLQSGMIVALRGKSGGYLSAYQNPPQALGLAPQAAGWEQWQYRVDASGRAMFVSYHGTALIIDPRSTVYHAPVVEWPDGGVQVVGLVGESATAKQRSAAAPIALNGLATLSAGGLLLCDAGQVLKIKPEPTTNVSTPDEWWTVVPIAAPDTSRAGTMQRALALGKRYFLQSAHGTFLDGRSNSGSQEVQLRTVHANGKAQSFGLEKVRSNDLREQFLTFGEPVRIHYKNFLLGGQSTPYYLKPATQTGGQFQLPLVEMVAGQLAGTEWTIVDPTGRYRAGDRVPLGVRIVLRNANTGKHLSADPTFEQLVVSPNAAGWEQWAIEE